MERKTKVTAEEGRQDLVITREFDLPVELLFKAHVDPELIEEWMGSKALKLEARPHGSWELQKTDAAGNVLFGAHGVFHDVIENKKITRTFEMANSPFGVQLELLTFERITDDTSRINMHVIYESQALRDQLLKLPFAHGINMAHDRLEEVLKKLVTQ